MRIWQAHKNSTHERERKKQTNWFPQNDCNNNNTENENRMNWRRNPEVVDGHSMCLVENYCLVSSLLCIFCNCFLLFEQHNEPFFPSNSQLNMALGATHTHTRRRRQNDRISRRPFFLSFGVFSSHFVESFVMANSTSSTDSSSTQLCVFFSSCRCTPLCVQENQAKTFCLAHFTKLHHRLRLRVPTVSASHPSILSLSVFRVSFPLAPCFVVCKGNQANAQHMTWTWINVLRAHLLAMDLCVRSVSLLYE